MRSIGEAQLALSIRTPLAEQTRKPIGCTDTPAPAPPAKGSSSGCGWGNPPAYSPPPATKPNETLEIGMIVVGIVLIYDGICGVWLNRKASKATRVDDVIDVDYKEE